MAPPGFNPHLQSESTQKTTRAALSQRLTTWEGLLNGDPEELEAEVKLLDKLSQQALGGIDIDHSKHEPKQNARKLAEEGKLSVTYFRLVSSSLPPQPISLIPRHSAVSHQRPAEDTGNEERLRHERAQEVAVDADWVISQSHKQQLLDNGPPTKTLVSRSSDINPSQLPHLLITERDRPTLNRSRAIEDGPSSPRCCPVVTVLSTGLDDQIKKRTRKRRFPPRERPEPHFFKPMKEWGGKSAGYAMGWRGSWPADKSGQPRYARDQMRKGITVAKLEQMS